MAVVIVAEATVEATVEAAKEVGKEEEERAVGLAVVKVVGEMEMAARVAVRVGAVRVGTMEAAERVEAKAVVEREVEREAVAKAVKTAAVETVAVRVEVADERPVGPPRPGKPLGLSPLPSPSRGLETRPRVAYRYARRLTSRAYAADMTRPHGRPALT